MSEYMDELKNNISEKYIINASYDDVINSEKNNFKFKNESWDHFEINELKFNLANILSISLDAYLIGMKDMTDKLKI